MKRILLFVFVVLPCVVNAAAPSTSCPSGYVAVDESYMTVATSCPSGTSAAGTANSCLVSSPSGSCIMYAPAGVSYTDSGGTYEYTEPCPLE